MHSNEHPSLDVLVVYVWRWDEAIQAFNTGIDEFICGTDVQLLRGVEV
jgi:hypothetical protein